MQHLLNSGLATNQMFQDLEFGDAVHMFLFIRAGVLIHLDLTWRSVSSLVILQDTKVGSSTTQLPRRSSSVNVLSLMSAFPLVLRHPHPHPHLHLHLLSSFPSMRNLRIWGRRG